MNSKLIEIEGKGYQLYADGKIKDQQSTLHGLAGSQLVKSWGLEPVGKNLVDRVNKEKVVLPPGLPEEIQSKAMGKKLSEIILDDSEEMVTEGLENTENTGLALFAFGVTTAILIGLYWYASTHLPPTREGVNQDYKPSDKLINDLVKDIQIEGRIQQEYIRLPNGINYLGSNGIIMDSKNQLSLAVSPELVTQLGIAPSGVNALEEIRKR